jgi:hypothetical protein
MRRKPNTMGPSWVSLHEAAERLSRYFGEGIRQWLLFILYGQHPQHVEWILQRQFRTPDEWLGEEGAKFRRPCGWRDASPEYLKAWAAFQEEHAADSIAVVKAALDRFHADPTLKQWLETGRNRRAAKARRLRGLSEAAP